MAIQKDALTLPFDPVSPLSDDRAVAIVEAAERANDRYLAEFLEKHNYCPFARQGRETGATDRFVHLAISPDLSPVLRYFERAAADPALEVVQVIFPLLVADPEPYVEFVHELTGRGNALVGGPDVFAAAALHPALPFREDPPLALVPLFRRTPDPTIQWTRNTTLEKIYEGRDGSKQFVDVADIEEIMQRPAPRDLYGEISTANHARAHKAPVKAVAALLNELHRDAQTSYQRILTTG